MGQDQLLVGVPANTDVGGASLEHRGVNGGGAKRERTKNKLDVKSFSSCSQSVHKLCVSKATDTAGI